MRNRNEVYCKTDGRLSWRNVSDLFGENDRLRRRVAELAAEKAALSAKIGRLREEVASFREQDDPLDNRAGSPLIRAALDAGGDAGPRPH